MLWLPPSILLDLYPFQHMRYLSFPQKIQLSRMLSTSYSSTPSQTMGGGCILLFWWWYLYCRVVIGLPRRPDDFGQKMEVAWACRHLARWLCLLCMGQAIFGPASSLDMSLWYSVCWAGPCLWPCTMGFLYNGHHRSRPCHWLPGQGLNVLPLLLLPSKRQSHWGSLEMTLSSVWYQVVGFVQCPAWMGMSVWRYVLPKGSLRHHSMISGTKIKKKNFWSLDSIHRSFHKKNRHSN